MKIKEKGGGGIKKQNEIDKGEGRRTAGEERWQEARLENEKCIEKGGSKV